MATQTAVNRYAKRKAPPKYEPGFFDIELGNIQRGLLRQNVRAIDASDSVQATDDTITADATGGAITVTLPPASQLQYLKVTIKRMNSGANAVTLSGTVDGTVNPSLASQYAAITIQSTGSVWIKLGSV